MDATQREASEREIDRVLAQADTDGQRLALLTQYIDDHKGRAAVAREKRNQIAARLRNEGVSMQQIAKMANVDDSYLARVLLNAGMEPRLRRGGRS